VLNLQRRSRDRYTVSDTHQTDPIIAQRVICTCTYLGTMGLEVEIDWFRCSSALILHVCLPWSNSYFVRQKKSGLRFALGFALRLFSKDGVRPLPLPFQLNSPADSLCSHVIHMTICVLVYL
jgi:hypothetical protein